MTPILIIGKFAGLKTRPASAAKNGVSRHEPRRFQPDAKRHDADHQTGTEPARHVRNSIGVVLPAPATAVNATFALIAVTGTLSTKAIRSTIIPARS